MSTAPASVQTPLQLALNIALTYLKQTKILINEELESMISARKNLVVLQETAIEKEVKNQLAPFQNEARKAQKALGEAKARRILHPLNWLSAMQGVNYTKEALRDAEIKQKTPEYRSKLSQEVQAHNANAARSRASAAQLKSEIERHNENSKICATLAIYLSDLKTTLDQRGWTHANCMPGLREIQQLLVDADFSGALDIAERLVFQKVPSDQQWAMWCQDSESILRDAKNDAMVGFVPLTAFQEVAKHACELAFPCCDAEISLAVMNDDAPVDRWYHLTGLLTQPRKFVHPVHWAMYWASFKASQEFACTSIAKAHEEHRSGRFLASVETYAQSWAGTRIDQMGFPKVTALLGTLPLGGLSAEARLGADFGIIVDIEVGGLVVRKVALLQAKKSTNGIADVGSDSTGAAKLTQLQKLNDPDRDFYIFYHEGVRYSSSPGPTVTPAFKVAEAASNLAAQSVKFDTRSTGWDWASFMAFGLCAHNSGVGRQLAENEDALTVLGSGNSEGLPESLLFISAGGGDYSLQLRLKVKKHYVESGTSFPRERGTGRNHEHKMR